MGLTEEQENKLITILNLKPSENFTRLETDYKTVKALVLLGLADEFETQNDSPSIRDFLDFCERNNTSEEEVTFESYACVNRPDSRFTVEGIVLNVSLSSERTKKEFIENFSNADEFNVNENYYRSWWD